MDLDLRLNPYPLYEAMRKTAPVVFNPQQGAWLLYGYEDVKRVLADHQNFSSSVLEGIKSELILEHSIQTMDQPRHTKLRALATHAFTPRAIAELEPRIREIANELLDKVQAQGEMDFVQDFAIPFPIIVIAEMLGIPSEDRGRFKHWSDVVVEASERLLQGVTEEDPAHVTAFRELRAYFERITQERRANPQGDIVSRLAQAEVEGSRLTDAEVVDFCILLLVAGNETTTNLLSNAMRSFIDFPDQWQLVAEQPSLIPQAIEETLRFRSPVQCLFRLAKQDVTIGDQVVKAGERVAVFMGSANRDESKFEQADRFDVTRPPSPHVTFGHGIHFCMGAPLARLEAKVALQALTERFQAFSLKEGAELEPLATFIVFGLRRLPVTFTARMAAARV